MELRQIKYFIEVAKREHVTEAAHALHVAQSAISRQIVNLETELGVDLFIREGRNVHLTPIGHMFLEHMEEATNVIDHAKQVVEEYVEPEKGTIRVGFPSSLAAYILPTSISSFRRKYPDAKFSLRQGSYHELIEAVGKGDINMAMLGPMPQRHKKIKGSILFTENIVALLPVSHPLAKSRSIRINQLQDDSFVLFPEGYVLRDIIYDTCEQIGFKPNVSFEGEDIDAIKGLVSAGLGISFIPEITLVDSIPPQTVKIPITEPKITRNIGVIIPRERKLLPTEKLFYEFVKDFFAILEKFQQ